MNLQGLSARMCQKPIDPSWLVPGAGIGKLSGSNGFWPRSIIGISTSRQVRQGRINAETEAVRKEQALSSTSSKPHRITIANNLNTRAVMPKIMVARRDGCRHIDSLCQIRATFVNVTPDGDFVSSSLITRRLRNMHITTIDDALFSETILKMPRAMLGQAGQQILLECVSSKTIRKWLSPKPTTQMEGLETGFRQSIIISSSDYFLRRLTFCR